MLSLEFPDFFKRSLGKTRSLIVSDFKKQYGVKEPPIYAVVQFENLIAEYESEFRDKLYRVSSLADLNPAFRDTYPIYSKETKHFKAYFCVDSKTQRCIALLATRKTAQDDFSTLVTVAEGALKGF